MFDLQPAIHRFNLWLFDVILTGVSLVLAHRLRSSIHLAGHSVFPLSTYGWLLQIIVPVIAFGLPLLGVYAQPLSPLAAHLRRLVKALFTCWTLILILQFFPNGNPTNRLLVLSTMVIHCFLLVSYRLVAARAKKVDGSSRSNGESLASLRTSGAVFNICIIGILSVIAWTIFQAAMNRVFVMDQVWYFAELQGDRSLRGGFHYLDYAATRHYWKGDDALFRPASFAWLAAGNHFFAVNHVAWNIANLALHVLVAFFLFRLLITFQPSPFAFLAAVLFLVMKVSTELVVWNHLGGYLLGWGFLAVALTAFTKVVRGNSPPLTQWIVYVVSLTVAELCHESIFLVSVLAAMLIVFNHWRRRGKLNVPVRVAPLVPIVVFSILYWFHVRHVERFAYVDRTDVGSLFDMKNVVSAIPKSLLAIVSWTKESMLFAAVRFLPATFNRFGKTFEPSLRNPAHLLNLVLLVLLLMGLVSAISRKHLRENWPLSVLLLGAVTAYVTVISFGRPENEVRSITYYSYFFVLIGITFLFSITDFQQMGRFQSYALGTILGAWILFNAIETNRLALEIHAQNEPASTYLEKVSRFVQEHRVDRGFSFAIENASPELDPPVSLHLGYPDNRKASTVKRLTEILFAPYYDTSNAQFRIDGSSSELSVRDRSAK
jgi:hypothetical protein